VIVVGLSHRDAPIDVRERLAVDGDEAPRVLVDLVARPTISEAIYLSTCNRVEVYAVAAASDADAARDVIEVLETIAARNGPRDVARHLRTTTGTDAVRHLFRVACSLDSLVVGEPQILGQVKDALEGARQAGTVARYLDKAMSRALHVAKRVRSETAIAAGQVSVSSVAVDLARQILDDLALATVALVGAGEMAEAAARQLVKEGSKLIVVNRSPARAAQLARDFGGEAVAWEDLEKTLARADVVIASTAAKTFLVTREHAMRAMKARRGRSLFFIDIAVPRNVDPAVNDLDNVYLYDIDNLSELVAESMRGRLAEADRAEALVQRELEGFEAWTETLNLTDTIVALRNKTRNVVMAEVERSLGGRLKALPAPEREALQTMVDAIVNKLLHDPVTRIKTAASEPHGDDLVHALAELFDLSAPGREPKRGAS
jgi:glutamyl-tRNA reductase